MIVIFSITLSFYHYAFFEERSFEINTPKNIHRIDARNHTINAGTTVASVSMHTRIDPRNNSKLLDNTAPAVFAQWV
jgi:hypothetical protein